MKVKEKEECRKLRKRGISVREIAKVVGVSKGSVSVWVRDINLSNEQIEKIEYKRKASASNSATYRERRRGYQQLGRDKIKKEDRAYAFGCALFWGEGNKNKNAVRFTNCDPQMLCFFVDFLRKYFDISNNSFTFNFQYYLNNNLTFEDIVSYWSNQLKLPKNRLRKCILKSKYYENNSKVKHPYGICSICVGNTNVVQQLYGSLKEMVNDTSDKWLF